MLTSDAVVRGKVQGTATTAYVINHNTDNTLATLRFNLKDLKIQAAEAEFTAGGHKFNAGSFIIKKDGNPGDLRQRLESAVTELGLTAQALEAVPDVKTHDLAVPRIAILHTWTNTQNEGWFRIEFDKLHIPYAYISDHVIRDTPNLRSKYDVIIFPPVGGTAQSIVNGMPKIGDPIPFKASDITPNFANAPDQTDDIRGGMEITGVANLQKFVEDGGLFVTVGNVDQIPIDYGITSGVAIQQSQRLQARGSIYNATFADRKSPIAYGYDEHLAIYFNQAPLLRVGGGPFGGFGGPGGGGDQAAGGQRESGRGTPSDPDIVQGRPPAPVVKGGDDEQEGGFFGNRPLPPEKRPRVVLKFNTSEKDLLVSGMLAGGSDLAGKPAVVDIPVGSGHVVMFANNPMWRHETGGSFFLLFNAALNYDHLGAGIAKTPPKENPEAQTSGDDDADN
jgi:hypothetical protein